MPATNTKQQPAIRPLVNRQLTLDEISEHVRTHIGQWLTEQSLAKPAPVYEIELRERMIRLEEELKSQRELMKQGFDLMDKHFEAVDKHFEAISAENNRRFEALAKRIDRLMLWSLGITMGTGSLVVAALKLLP
uniref:DUF1640 domain-containing protein n=1 Tax=Candidatus Kentrum sp. TC TaxID=2126339 RepID=A0A451AE93_9GAMM|nr:MAG: hypothetical protein BECKTC1821F_GA0114240_11218 [Candidatus Kentron sp. TC]